MDIRRHLPTSALFGALWAASSGAFAQGDRQTVLGPGMYVFQTRTTSASCYRADGQLCRVEHDALLRRIDQL